MARPIHVTPQPVVLDGYQAVMKPSKFGYSLSAIVDQAFIDSIQDDYEEGLKWAESKLKNPKRGSRKPEPWEEVSEGQFKIKMSWNEDNRPTVVDTEGTLITDENVPIYSGSLMKLAVQVKPYALKDGVTYGSSLKLKGAQLISASGGAGFDSGDLTEEDVAALFGKAKGFKQAEPNVTTTPVVEDEDEDIDF
jgi:hypothetical protein